MPAKSRNHAVAVAFVLHLQHGALVGLVHAGNQLRYHAVEARALKPAEPVLGKLPIASGGRNVNRRSSVGHHTLKPFAALLERNLSEVAGTVAEQVEKDNRRRSLLGQHAHTRFGGMKPELQRIKIQTVLCSDYDLTVDHAARWELRPKRIEQLRKVPIQRLQVAALQQDVVAVPEDDCPETIPLRLENPVRPRGDLVDTFGQHWRNWRADDEIHRTQAALSIAPGLTCSAISFSFSSVSFSSSSVCSRSLTASLRPNRLA